MPVSILTEVQDGGRGIRPKQTLILPKARWGLPAPEWAESGLSAAQRARGLKKRKRPFGLGVGSRMPEPARKAESGLTAVQR